VFDGVVVLLLPVAAHLIKDHTSGEEPEPRACSCSAAPHPTRRCGVHLTSGPTGLGVNGPLSSVVFSLITKLRPPDEEPVRLVGR